MAAGGKKGALMKLRKELQRIHKEPPANIQVAVQESNMLEWHYLLEGPDDTPYAGGWYHGKLKFTPEYPFKPPGILMFTPSGRFEVNMHLCLSISDYHPESWNPGWSVATVLVGVLSFMTGDEITTGSIETDDDEKRRLAKLSMQHNLKNPTFAKLFPDAAQRARNKAQGVASAPAPAVLLAQDADEEASPPAAAPRRASSDPNGSNGAALTSALVLGGQDTGAPPRGRADHAPAQRAAVEDGGVKAAAAAAAPPPGSGPEAPARGAEPEAARVAAVRCKTTWPVRSNGSNGAIDAAGCRPGGSETGGQGEHGAGLADAPRAVGEAGELRPGDRAMIAHLTKQVELNGIRCTVREGASPAGRVRVRRDDTGKELLLKISNLDLLGPGEE